MSGAAENITSTYHVSLTIPCLAEYVSIARLAILGVAGRMQLSYDEVEDVRLAVGEACTHAVERAAVQWLDSETASREQPVTNLKLECSVAPESLTIEIFDTIPAGKGNAPKVPDDQEAFEEAGIDRQHLSALLMEILVDEVKVKSGPEGTCVRLVKYAAQS